MEQCFGSGSGIRCLFDPWIRDPGWVKNQDPDPGSGSGMNKRSRIRNTELESNLEEGIQAALSVSLPALEELFGAVPDALLAEIPSPPP